MAEQIVLVGQFKDNITPQLKKLSKELENVAKSFTKIQKKLRPITKEMGKLAMASERVAVALKNQKNAIDSNTRSWKTYQTAVGKAGRAQRSAFKGAPRGGVAAPKVPFARPMPMPMGGGKGGGVGVGELAAASFLGGSALMAATAAIQGLTRSAMGFVQAGSRAEQGVIQMAGTLQTLGKIGDFGKARALATNMMGELADIAAALPGATNDYLRILQMTLDDQIQAYGSADKVTANLKEGERSFTALFGMSAQLAGLRPEIAAMDMNQLRMNPRNIRQVQLLSRNPTLQKFYLEELERNGGNFFKALDVAMKKAITPQQIEALKKSFDSAFQTLVTSFTDPYSGVFGAMRKLSVSINGVTEKGVTVMDYAGELMFGLNTLFEQFSSMFLGGPLDPMVALAKALYHINFFLGFLSESFKMLTEGEISFGEFVRGLADLVGQALGGLATYVANLDYEQFFKYVDEFISNLFIGLVEGFSKTFDASADGKGLLGKLGFGTSFTGTIVATAVAFKALTIAIGLTTGALAFLQGAAATLGGWLGATTAALTFFKGALAVILAGVKVAFVAFLAPVLAVAGAVMIVIAIVRNFGDILKLIGAGIKGWWASTKKMWLSILKLFLQGIEKILSIIPGAGGLADKAGEAISTIDEQIAQATAEQTAAQKEASDALQGMADQFKTDSEAIKSFFSKQFGGGTTEGATPAPAPTSWQEGMFDGAAIKSPIPIKTPQLDVVDQSTKAVQTSVDKTTTAVTKLTDPIKTGATDIKTQVASSSSAVETKLSEISGKLTSPMKVDIVASIPLDMKMSIAGGLGGATGGPATLTPLAQQFGLIMTSGYRPGDSDSYHGIDRARDYAGDPQQMMAYAQAVAGLFGNTLKELIYTPLGYSIKNGQVVPPYAQGTHYDHVHVAYALGQGQPAFFSSQDEAVKWEKMMAPRDSSIQSITTNSSEIGGDKVYNQTVTVNIDGRSVDDDELGNSIAEKILVSMRKATYTELDVT